MRRYIFPLVLSVLLLGLSGCSADESTDAFPAPTAVPLYTPAPAVAVPAVGERAVVGGEPDGEAAGEGDTEETPAEAEAISTPEEAEATPEADVVTGEAEAVEESEVATAEPAGTTEATETEALTDTEGIAITGTDVVTSTDAVTSTDVITAEERTSESETSTEPTPAETPAEDAGQTPEPTVEVTGEVTSTATATETPGAAQDDSAATEAAESETATEEEASPTLPEEIATALENASAENGEQIAVTTGCSACHSLQEGVVQVGPSWYNVAGHAETRVEGQSAEYYLYNSIVAPNDFVVEGFLPNLMPTTYGDILNDQQIADMIAYLLTLREE